MDLEKVKQEALEKNQPGIGFDALLTEVKKHILVPDDGLIKITLASVVANGLPGSPFWLFLVGPSSGGKTMTLSLMRKCPEIYPISTLTPNTFVSGDKKFRGILFELGGKILSFKDFTTILSTNEEARREIMGQMREIYDGEFSKSFGTGKQINWKGKVGFIAGVTSIIDMDREFNAALGERFVNYRLVMPGREEVGMLSLKNSSKNQEEQSNNLEKAQDAFYKCVLAAQRAYDPTVKISELLTEEQLKKLVRVADFATLARSPVIRERGATKDIIFKPTAEMPGRFAQQLNYAAIALMLINKANGDKGEMKILDQDEKILWKIALDSIPHTRRVILQKLIEHGKLDTVFLATAMKYPTSVIRRNLEDLNMQGLVERIKAGKSDKWQVVEYYGNIMKEFDDIKELSEEERLIQEAELANRINPTDENGAGYDASIPIPEDDNTDLSTLEL